MEERDRIIYNAHCQTSGGYICGETKLAMTLRILAGGSYLDVSALYRVGYGHTNEIFHYVIKNWICNDKFTGLDYLDNEAVMNRTAANFKSKGCHQGILAGVIGSLDGWIVKIRRPSRKKTLET